MWKLTFGNIANFVVYLLHTPHPPSQDRPLVVSHLTLMELHFLTHTLRPLGLLPRDNLSLTPLALLVKGKHPQVFYYKFCTIGFFFIMKETRLSPVHN